MNIRAPITISPHIIEGKPRGYYILVHSLWKDQQPILFRDQFAGFHRGKLILTMAHPGEWNTFIKAIIFSGESENLPHRWLSSVKMTRMGTGVRFYLPSRILRPKQSAEAIKVMGTVRKASYGSGDVIYVSVPNIDANVLLGRGDLK